jgi:hypothetical protein
LNLRLPKAASAQIRDKIIQMLRLGLYQDFDFFALIHVSVALSNVGERDGFRKDS